MVSRPLGGKQALNPWGSNKVQRTISVTNTCWELWTVAAQEVGINRSELMEVLSRKLEQLDVGAMRNELLGRPTGNP
ncbi:MAG: hypothetical protein ACO29V_10780 [Limnohabitans sp.]